MLPIRFKYLDPMKKSKKKTILRKSKIRNKAKTHRANQQMDFLPAKKKRRKSELSG